jgi:hypothetical protein
MQQEAGGHTLGAQLALESFEAPRAQRLEVDLALDGRQGASCRSGVAPTSSVTPVPGGTT